MAVEKVAYIYCLREPGDGAIRYIGVTLNPEIRFYQHLGSRRRPSGNRKDRWIAALGVQGHRPVMEILDEVTIRTRRGDETAWIEWMLQQGHPLLNGAERCTRIGIADLIEARKGKPIREVLLDHQRQFHTVIEIAADWRCTEASVRRALKKHNFTLRRIAFISDRELTSSET